MKSKVTVLSFLSFLLLLLLVHGVVLEVAVPDPLVFWCCAMAFTAWRSVILDAEVALGDEGDDGADVRLVEEEVGAIVMVL